MDLEVSYSFPKQRDHRWRPERVVSAPQWRSSSLGESGFRMSLLRSEVCMQAGMVAGLAMFVSDAVATKKETGHVTL